MAAYQDWQTLNLQGYYGARAGRLSGELLALLQYRASVNTCVNTFMRERLRQATHPDGDGKIHCFVHTTLLSTTEARTGRLSSNPSFMNIPTLKLPSLPNASSLAATSEAPGFSLLPNVCCYIDVGNDEEVRAKL